MKDGQAKKVMQLFQQVQQEGMNPNIFIFVLVIKACAYLGALQDGRHVHQQPIQSGCKSYVFVGSSVQNVGALRMLGECPTICQLKMWSLGTPFVTICQFSIALL